MPSSAGSAFGLLNCRTLQCTQRPITPVSPFVVSMPMTIHRQDVCVYIVVMYPVTDPKGLRLTLLDTGAPYRLPGQQGMYWRLNGVLGAGVAGTAATPLTCVG